MDLSFLRNNAKLENHVNKAKMVLFGTRSRSGVLFLAFVYIMLISIGFIYLYPILHMFVTSFMSLDDLLMKQCAGYLAG